MKGNPGAVMRAASVERPGRPAHKPWALPHRTYSLGVGSVVFLVIREDRAPNPPLRCVQKGVKR